MPKMTKGKSYTLSTGLFYLVVVTTAMIVGPNMDDGPFGLRIGAALFLLTVFVSGIAFLISAVARLTGGRAWTGPLIVNAVVLVLGILYLTSVY
jgi:hypothetical protein